MTRSIIRFICSLVLLSVIIIYGSFFDNRLSAVTGYQPDQPSVLDPEDPIYLKYQVLLKNYAQQGKTMPEAETQWFKDYFDQQLADQKKYEENTAELNRMKEMGLVTEPIEKAVYSPLPASRCRVFLNPEAVDIYSNMWPYVFGKETIDSLHVSSIASTPYNMLLSGHLKSDPTTGVIYTIYYTDECLDHFTLALSYADRGTITFSSLAGDNNMIALFTWRDDKQGYFDTHNNTAFFEAYDGDEQN
jgi:hypothetical protein